MPRRAVLLTDARAGRELPSWPAQFSGVAMSDNLSIKWRDREIENPLMRKIAIVVGIPIFALCAGAAILMLFAGVVLLFTVCVVTFPLHLALRLCGRRGFVTSENGSLTYSPSWAGFRRAAS